MVFSTEHNQRTQLAEYALELTYHVSGGIVFANDKLGLAVASIEDAIAHRIRTSEFL